MGLTREVSLIQVPDAFIDQYDLHLGRGRNAIEGWIHVVRGQAASSVKVEIPELNATGTAKLDENGRAPIQFAINGLRLWSPEDPRLYKVTLHPGDDTVDDLIGFRTIETSGTTILLNGKPIFLRGISIHSEAPYRTGRAYSEEDAETLLT